MGEIADQMLEGLICEGCGCELDGESPGFARRCSGCGGSQRQESQQRRANNREQSAERLREAGISFERKNAGAHLIVQHAGRVVDFWPGTGKYIEREGARARGRGVFNLLKALKS